MTAHVLKLCLGLIFEISNILSLGWGNSRTYLSGKKNVDGHGSTQKNQKKERKKIKSQKFRSLKKMFISVKNKKTNSSTVLPILSDSRKKGWQIINV